MKTNLSKFALFSFLFSNLFFTAACFGPSIDLTEKGRHVQLKTVESGHEKNVDGEEVKSLKCNVGTNGHNYLSNREGCANFLRNQAAVAGADLVIAEPAHNGISPIWGMNCSHCVEMVGVAYKTKGHIEVPPPVPVVVEPPAAQHEPKAEVKPTPPPPATASNGSGSGGSGLGPNAPKGPKGPEHPQTQNPKKPHPDHPQQSNKPATQPNKPTTPNNTNPGQPIN
jgi:hypothetical protein